MSFTIFGALRRLDESRQRAELYRAMHTGVVAGLTPRMVLGDMGKMSIPAIEEARQYLVVGLGTGRSIGALVRARPKLFAPFEGAVLTAGDESGTLEQSLRLLTDYYTFEFKRCLKVRDALSYPMFVGLVASFGLPFVLMPKGQVKSYIAAISVMLAAFLLLGGALFSIMASMMLNSAARTRARFARVLAATIEAGLPLGRAVRLSVEASGNRALAEHIKKRPERELSSTPLATLFDGCDEVPAGLLGQMRVADATGDYRGTLTVYAREIEEQQK